VDPASTSFVLGYHGCDGALAERVFAGRASLTASHNDYDWLGDGIYFWEHNARRAFEFATEIARRPRNKRQKIKKPAVVGAVIDLGFCLNLLDGRYIQMLRLAHLELERSVASAGLELPKNSGGDDLLNRKLDCAVIRMLHQRREEAEEAPFDTVRAVFVEGQRLYKNAGFRTKNHIQICVCNPRCIKGYFRPLDDAGKPIRFK
jgi:hypothetical protein